MPYLAGDMRQHSLQGDGKVRAGQCFRDLIGASIVGIYSEY